MQALRNSVGLSVYSFEWKLIMFTDRMNLDFPSTVISNLQLFFSSMENKHRELEFHAMGYAAARVSSTGDQRKGPVNSLT